MTDETKKRKRGLSEWFDLTDLFYFAGLAASTWGIYLKAGEAWAWLWAGCILLLTAVKAA